MILFFSHCKDASAAPSNVRTIVVNSTVISVQWDGIKDCRDVNGRIKWYRVQYTSEFSGVVQSKYVLGRWDDSGLETLLTGLTPNTTYTIRVAAVDVEGYVGLYSSPINISTIKLGMFVNDKPMLTVHDPTKYIIGCSGSGIVF